MNSLKILLKENICEYNKEEYSSLLKVLTYPKDDEKELISRLTELRSLGVGAIELTGPTKLNNLRVLGKGTMGVIVLGYWKELRVVIKVLRTDVNATMEKEARCLEIANSVGVGPRLVSYSRNFLVREFIDGETLEDVVVSEEPRTLLKIALQALHQAFKLDLIGLSHKELARPGKHIIVRRVDFKPFIIDFGAASTSSKKRNLTQLIQYFFIKDNICSSKIMELKKRNDNFRAELLVLLKEYKENPRLETFRKILNLVKTYFDVDN